MGGGKRSGGSGGSAAPPALAVERVRAPHSDSEADRHHPRREEEEALRAAEVAMPEQLSEAGTRVQDLLERIRSAVDVDAASRISRTAK